MSLVTQQLLLQARSDRDDALRNLSIGDDTRQVRDRLNSANKRITSLEAQMKEERAAAAAKVATKNDEKKSSSRPRPPRNSDSRSSLPDDIELPCIDCASSFTFSGKDQLFFMKNNYKQPMRCAGCRDAKKSAKPAGTMITCLGCKADFLFTDAKQAIFEEKGWAIPKRCVTCKAARTQAHAEKTADV